MWGQHAPAMPKTDENVLVVRRSLFDELGAFQGLQPDVDRYLAAFLRRETTSSCHVRVRKQIRLTRNHILCGL